ncbi:MAG: hypothetical protein P4L93_04480 [Coriobacteriia bacterium]|nr:hypothetical protein [Coriobacteriia bacterium]
MRRIRAAAALVLGVALLMSVAGCATIAQQATKSAVESATGVKVDQSNGKTTITGQNGTQATISSGENKLPDGLPSYMPAYSGTIKSSSAIATDKGTNFTFSVITGDPAQTVVDWYKQKFAENGWTVTGTIMNGDQGMVSAKKGETDNAVVTIGKNSDGKTAIAAIVDIKK